MGEASNRKYCFGLVLVAAGKGIRFGGGVPKQFHLLSGEPVYAVALRKFLSIIGQAVVVVPKDMVESVAREIKRYFPDSADNARIVVTAGGESRHESVHNGLLVLDEKCSHVLVHDAARPFLSESLIVRVAEATLEFGAAVPLSPVTDTVKMVSNGMVRKTMDRELLWKAQTPQGAERDQLINLSQKALDAGFKATDESSLLEREGLAVRAVEGEEGNIKITWKKDLDRGIADETRD